MSSEPQGAQAAFSPPNIIIPEDWKAAKLVLTDYLIKMAEAVNAREVSQYQDVGLDSAGSNISQVVNGQVWFTPGDANKFRYGSRTVIDFGALPNNGTSTAAHGIAVTSNTVFTSIRGTASLPGTTYIPLPYPETAGNPVEVWIDATNVNIRTVSDYSAYTQAYIVLDWVSNV